MTQSSEDMIVQKYVRFCENPFRNSDAIMREYKQLKSHPRVVSVGFLNSNVLIVGTDKIIITYNEKRHLIGEFMIFLVRAKCDGYWETEFRFWNVTNPIFTEGDSNKPPEVYFIHPHIYPTEDSLLSVPNGKLCISKGQFPVYQHMRKGQIHLVVPRLIEILEVYPTGQPYCDVDYWPVIGGQNA